MIPSLFQENHLLLFAEDYVQVKPIFNLIKFREFYTRDNYEHNLLYSHFQIETGTESAATAADIDENDSIV